jgi:hypothetical protein
MDTMSRFEGANVAIVHSVDGIELLLRRGLSPITDNRDALLALGFARTYPQIARGYESTIWERSVEYSRATYGRRALARQRAFLDCDRRR